MAAMSGLHGLLHIYQTMFTGSFLWGLLLVTRTAFISRQQQPCMEEDRASQQRKSEGRDRYPDGSKCDRCGEDHILYHHKNKLCLITKYVTEVRKDIAK